MRKLFIAFCLISIIALAACGGRGTTNSASPAAPSMQKSGQAPSPVQQPIAQPSVNEADPLSGSLDTVDSSADDQNLNQVDDVAADLDSIKDI